MAFKGEIGAEFLDNVKTGFTVGDIYRIIDAGKLGGVDIPFGTFVEWKGTAWEVKKDMQYATSETGESLDKATADVLDDHASGQVTEEETMPAAEAANYTVGNYFEQDGEIWKCTDKTDNGDGTWTVEAEKVNGVVPVLNELVNAPPKGRTEYTLDVTVIDNLPLPVSIEANSMTRLNVKCTNTSDRTVPLYVKPDSFIYVDKTNNFYKTDFNIGRHVNGSFAPITKFTMTSPDISFGTDTTEALAPSGHGVPESFDDVKTVYVCGTGADVTVNEHTMKGINRFVIHVVSETFAIIYIPMY